MLTVKCFLTFGSHCTVLNGATLLASQAPLSRKAWSKNTKISLSVPTSEV